MALISVENLTIAFDGVVAVQDVSFAINRGDYWVILGENGSGKSTLVRAMLGLVRPRSGVIRCGEGLQRSQIGYLPQQTALQRSFPASVEEVVRSGCVNRIGFRPFMNKKDAQRAERNMKLLNIEDKKRESYRNLSGGQQQRVLLARALCATDGLLLLDEPVTGLDPATSAEMYDVIARLNREQNVAVVMISHDVESALRHASHVLVMDRGADFIGTKADYVKKAVKA